MSEATVLPLKKVEEFGISSVTIVVGYKTKDGKIEETVQEIDASTVQISGFKLDHNRKHKSVKNENGDFIGFEPTGEETINLTVKFIKG